MLQKIYLVSVKCVMLLMYKKGKSYPTKYAYGRWISFEYKTMKSDKV